MNFPFELAYRYFSICQQYVAYSDKAEPVVQKFLWKYDVMIINKLHHAVRFWNAGLQILLSKGYRFIVYKYFHLNGSVLSVWISNHLAQLLEESKENNVQHLTLMLSFIKKLIVSQNLDYTNF